MKPTKQFWTLVKFQYLLNPMMWYLPFIIGFMSIIPNLIQGHHSTYHSDLSFYLNSNQTFFFVCIFGSMILAPEKFQFGRTKMSAGFSGTEFLLTRAVDRPLVYRSKAILVHFLILLLPICSLIYFLRTPELIVNESSKNQSQQVISHVPGSILVAESNSYRQPNIVIPNGNVFVAAWRVWNFLLAIVVLQAMVTILSPFKFGSKIFWALCYLGLLVPAFLPLYSIKMQTEDLTSPVESVFYFFMDHQTGVWIVTLLGAALCQFLCERNFVRQEQ